MIQDATSIQSIENLITEVLAADEDIFLVSVRIKPTNNIKVFLDADNGLSIDNCVKINRTIYHIIEEKGWYPDGNFSLEVSSPGVEEPLKLLRQYRKNVGRNVQVHLNDDTLPEGKLIKVDENSLTLEYIQGKNKKAITLTKEILFTEVKQTIVLLAF